MWMKWKEHCDVPHIRHNLSEMFKAVLNAMTRTKLKCNPSINLTVYIDLFKHYSSILVCLVTVQGTYSSHRFYQIMIMFDIHSLDLRSLCSLNNVRDYGSTLWKGKESLQTINQQLLPSPQSTAVATPGTSQHHITPHKSNECAHVSQRHSSSSGLCDLCLVPHALTWPLKCIITRAAPYNFWLLAKKSQ